MLANLKNLFKVADLRNKILFTIAMVVVYRFGIAIRVPGVDPLAIDQIQDQAEQQGAIGFLNLFSGGGFESFSIFALGIMPYITSSIIMQILGVVIPRLEQLQQEGAVGQRKITQYTRYVTIALATLQATGLVFVFGNGRASSYLSQNAPSVPILPDGLFPRAYLIIPTLVAGTAVLMWLGELISQRGIGNGMSMVIFASVVSGMPYGFYSIILQNKWIWFVLVVLLTLGIIVAVVYVELGQRRIPVQFAKRVVGRRMYGGQNTYIPLKVNQSGVIPVIFASSILLIPVIISNIVGSDSGWRGSIVDFVNDYIVDPQNLVYITIFALMIIAFAYFYNSIAFDPVRQADQIRRQGGFIPGVRPGPQTERYLARVVNRITLPGAVFIAIIAILPYLLLWAADVSTFGFAGTSILISVGVALELMRQIDSQLTLRNYEGFLK
ncbi:preprotein translocase subunit SecY [Desertimonas flava]|uniref:preprotein translocase subunit SecY n=1 Tax=Desertimonas flava TaxID=2064846 RepID=UPI000E349F93|nr:preprotein translocase subunit SecY [Desertimonas flava]